jgi:hypothetical protein
MNTLTVFLTTVILAASVSTLTLGGDQVSPTGPPATNDAARCLSCGIQQRKPHR